MNKHVKNGKNTNNKCGFQHGPEKTHTCTKAPIPFCSYKLTNIRSNHCLVHMTRKSREECDIIIFERQEPILLNKLLLLLPANMTDPLAVIHDTGDVNIKGRPDLVFYANKNRIYIEIDEVGHSKRGEKEKDIAREKRIAREYPNDGVIFIRIITQRPNLPYSMFVNNDDKYEDNEPHQSKILSAVVKKIKAYFSQKKKISLTTYSRLVFNDRAPQGNLFATQKNTNELYNNNYLQTDKNIKR